MKTKVTKVASRRQREVKTYKYVCTNEACKNFGVELLFDDELDYTCLYPCWRSLKRGEVVKTRFIDI